MTRVTICLVTYNSADDLAECFKAVGQQLHESLDVVVIDCGSHDASVETARTAPLGEVPRRVIALGENRGFAGGMNAALRETDAPWILTLNADARPSPTFIRRLLERGLRTQSSGAITGRLIRPTEADGTRRIDACGMYLVPTWRHLDRGSDEVEGLQFGVAERVFGATGAATLWRREALEDAAVEGEIFAEDFHSYREDAELCFRLRERGWEVIYEPAAIAEHRRHVLPERRKDLPAMINYHSLKNRYLLRIWHQTSSNLRETFFLTLWRDLLALGYVLTQERSSLPAYRWLWQHRKRLFARRQLIQSRRKISEAEVDRWFFQHSLPL